jgi:hypothetical protein
MSLTYFFRPYHCPGVDSAPSENEYQEHFLGVKAAGAWGWQPHHLHAPNVMESWRLNLLEPSGPYRACYGTPLPLPQKSDMKKLSHWGPKILKSLLYFAFVWRCLLSANEVMYVLMCKRKYTSVAVLKTLGAKVKNNLNTRADRRQGFVQL